MAEAIAWQERIDQWPAVARYKAMMDGHTGPATPVLEIGVGPGVDAARTGALGLDRSRAMAIRSHQRGVPVVVGDAHGLPVADRSVAAVRADRVLQHLDAPQVAIEEMVRVLRPGGVLVVADPDQTTLSITVPGVPDRITSAIRKLRGEVGYRNGRIAAEVPALLAGLGMTDIQVDGSALVLTDPAQAFGLSGWVSYWAETAGFTESDDRLWRQRLATSTNAGFLYTVTYLVTSARKEVRR